MIVRVKVKREMNYAKAIITINKEGKITEGTLYKIMQTGIKINSMNSE